MCQIRPGIGYTKVEINIDFFVPTHRALEGFEGRSSKLVGRLQQGLNLANME